MFYDLFKLEVAQHEDGYYRVLSPEIPGLFLAGRDLGVLLADVPEVVDAIKRLDAQEKPK